EVSVAQSEVQNLNFMLLTGTSELEEVVVSGESTISEIQSRPMTVTSLDAQALTDQALGAEELLKQTSGVVVRQIGGLGSNININLNGLTGNSVRFYYDGIPLEVFGGGLQLNNIPVDALQRMDVYKGVMPVEIGTDALGGGINLVPYQTTEDYLRTSYTIGSFNTHRFTLGGGKQIGNKLYLSALGYINYSGNDFLMRGIRNSFERENTNGFIVPDEEIIDARRFHDQHYSSFVELSTNISEIPWADELKVSASYSDRSDEIQNGQFLLPTAVGEADRSIETFSQRIDYRKFFFKRLNLRYFGVLSHTSTLNRDSSLNIYNWKGEVLSQAVNQSGAELFAIPTARAGRELGTAHRLALNYQINDFISLTLSDFYRYNRIDGNDPLGARISLEGEVVDPNTIPSKLWRNIFGAELTTDLLNEKITGVAFYKNYFYQSESIDILRDATTFIPVRNVSESLDGYGFAVKYQITPALLLRSSFERAARIPTQNEIFGDFGVIVPNYTLKPETSNNINLGIRFDQPIGNVEQFSFQVDGFIRNRENLIRIVPFGTENAQFVNEAKVDGRGIEAALAVTPTPTLKFNGNFTYQSNQIASPQLNGSVLTGAQVPNIPNLFGNASVSYTFEDLISDDFDLEVFGNYFYTARYSINEVKDLETANPLFVVPEQHLLNLGLVASPNIEGLRVSFTLRNATNSLIYDNFRIPRPGINYSLKINYSL
ncbi:MAG: TonB-dependent receptor, partial [Bacteroidota bacterium]